MNDIIFSDIQSIGAKQVPYSEDEFAEGGVVRNSPTISANSFKHSFNLLWLGSDGKIYQNSKDVNLVGRWKLRKASPPKAIIVQYNNSSHITFVDIDNDTSLDGNDAIPILSLDTGKGLVATKGELVAVDFTNEPIESIEEKLRAYFLDNNLLSLSKSSTKSSTKSSQFPFIKDPNQATTNRQIGAIIKKAVFEITGAKVSVLSGRMGFEVKMVDRDTNIPNKLIRQITEFIALTDIDTLITDKRVEVLSDGSYKFGLGLHRDRVLTNKKTWLQWLNSVYEGNGGEWRPAKQSVPSTTTKLDFDNNLYAIWFGKSYERSGILRAIQNILWNTNLTVSLSDIHNVHEGTTSLFTLPSTSSIVTTDDKRGDFDANVDDSHYTELSPNDLTPMWVAWKLKTHLDLLNNRYKVWLGEDMPTSGADSVSEIAKALQSKGLELSAQIEHQPMQTASMFSVGHHNSVSNNLAFDRISRESFDDLDIEEITLAKLFEAINLAPTTSISKPTIIPNSDLQIGDVVEITEDTSPDFGTQTTIKDFLLYDGEPIFHLTGIAQSDGEDVGFSRDMLKLALKGENEAEDKALAQVNNSQNRFILGEDGAKELQDISDLLEYFDGTTDVSMREKLYREADRIIKKRYGNEQTANAGFGINNTKNLITPRNLLDYYYTQTTQSPVAKIEEACELPTPNGKKSKLPLQTYFAVRTPYFKRWFGDWIKAYDTGEYSNCSLVIDEDTKEPRIMYHGVRKFVQGFGSFANMGQGVKRPYGSFEPPKFPASYFGDNLKYVEFYGGNAKNMKKPNPDYEGFYYNVFLNMRNPIRLDLLGFEATYTDFIDYMFVKYGINVVPDPLLVGKLGGLDKKNKTWVYVRNSSGMIDTLKENGYDGIVQLGDVPKFDENGNVTSKPLIDREYLTFYPNQVKSANVRNSFYLGFFNDIRFKDGGNVSI